MSATNDPSLTGDIQFFDNYVPRLDDGDYRITVSQRLVGAGETGPNGEGPFDVDQTFTETQKFTVVGPRFRLDPADIHREFPPSNNQGRFERVLPHITLRKRALPWERDVFGDKGIPWLALLVLEENEVLAPDVGSAVDKRGTANPTKVTSITLDELVDPGTGVVAPAVTFDPYENAATTLCQVIDIAPTTFGDVMMAKGDLAYLTHCREVSIEHKSSSVTVEAAGSQTTDRGTQWFSSVISGRFPAMGARSIAHLVSLEGLTRYVRANEGDPPVAFPSGTERVRLVSLAGWSFTCLEGVGQSFEDLMCKLVPEHERDRDELLLRFPVPDLSPSPTAAEQFAHAALEVGYTARRYATRQGENSFAWYRGPFAPALPERFPANRPRFEVAGQAAVYDKTYGLLDHSYSAAFEIGRLAAVHSGTFSPLLLAWRKSSRQLLDMLQTRLSSDVLKALLDTSDGQLQSEQVLDEALVSRSFIKYLATKFVDIESTVHAPHLGTPLGVGDIIRQPPPNPAGQLAAALADDKIKKFLTELDYAELAPIVSWLANLYLLKGVPFEYLVSDDRVLPAESLRFFYVDRNWLDSLVDGALSVGVQHSVDHAFQNLMFDVVRDAVYSLIHTVRDELIGIKTHSPGDAGNGPLAGLLLRSAVVSGWPGLEVKAARTVSPEGDVDPIALLRMDHLANNVLLCLFPELPAFVAINEPQEGLHFGVEDGNKLDLRHLSGPRVGCLLESQQFVTANPDANRRLDLQTLRGTMKRGLGLGSDLGPADFAVEMVDVPERFVYQVPS